MTLQQRDKRALAGLGVAVVLSLAIAFWPSGDSAPQVVSALPTSIPQAEQRLDQLNKIVATVAGKQKVLDALNTQLVTHEKGLLPGDTAAQAQAGLLKRVQSLARAQSPPIDIGQVEMGPIRPIAKSYGETQVTVVAICRIEQLVQLLADLSAQPELIATSDLQVNVADSTKKTVTVRLTVSGLVPLKLVPERKTGGLF